jgi:DNA-directed RNA polymerase specialized sigma subunit
LCHQGFIEQTVQRHVHQFDGESPEEALQVLRQEAWAGINHGIDRYDFDYPAKPLTYIRSWMWAMISAATEREGRLIRLKSKAHDFGKKVQATAKKIQNEGHQVTIAEIADRLQEKPERIAEVLPYVNNIPVRLDAPISTGNEGEDTIGSVTVDPHQQVEDPIMDQDSHKRVRRAVDSIESPFRRKVIELFYGLADNEHVEQKDLFDGVYRDNKGRAFSAEPSVISDRKKRGEKVTKRSQKELNRLFYDGKLSFEPGTPEAAELARINQDDFNPDAPFEKMITRKTGIPPTSGTIQEAKRKAEEEMRSSPILSGLAPRYRGENELEASEVARDQVRQALLRLKAIETKDLAKYRATRGTQGQKSELRKLAEQHSLVDPQNGRLDKERLQNILSK